MFQRLYFMILCMLNLRENTKCILNSRRHFNDPLPVIIRAGRLLEPTDEHGNFEIQEGEELRLSCGEWNYLQHPNIKDSRSDGTVTCAYGSTFQNEDWLNAPSPFEYFSCSDAPEHRSQQTNRTCYSGFPIHEVGYVIDNQFYPLYESCFNDRDLRVIYSKYTQKPYNALYQTKIKRPFFKDDNNFNGLSINYLMSPRGQKSAVASLIGPRTEMYINDQEFLARGHLAAKTDFVLAFGERATFHYVNCAPQWNGLNGGNWNTLEVDLRNHVSRMGYDTIIYTGTYRVSYLKNDKNLNIDLYLHFDSNNNPVVPVPLYFYKVVYEPQSQRGIAFVGINNPYCTLDEAQELFFCQDICRLRNEFRWLTWHPDRSQEGYSFCCTVDDFKRTVDHLPEFEVNGVLP